MKFKKHLFCNMSDVFQWNITFTGVFSGRQLQCFLYGTVCSVCKTHIYFHQSHFVFLWPWSCYSCLERSLFHKFINCYDEFEPFVHTWGWTGGIFQIRRGLRIFSKWVINFRDEVRLTRVITLYGLLDVRRVRSIHGFPCTNIQGSHSLTFIWHFGHIKDHVK